MNFYWRVYIRIRDMIPYIHRQWQDERGYWHSTARWGNWAITRRSKNRLRASAISIAAVIRFRLWAGR